MSEIRTAPFDRGQTFYNGGTIDTNNYGGTNLEGHEQWFEDIVPGGGDGTAITQRTNFKVKCRIVRNVSGIALLPGRLASFQATAGNYGNRVDGYATTTAARGYPIDEYLPAAGVPNGDLFWLVMEGPALVKTDLAGGANNVFSVGTAVVALTAVTSQSTTAGRVAPQDLTGATATLAAQIQNFIGYALTAKTTSNTNADMLVAVGHW